MNHYSLKELQHMSQEKIRYIVGESSLAQLQSKNPKPLIKVFSIAHEGAANGVMVGHGPTKVRYYADAVRSLYERIQMGTKCFLGHAKDNSHEDRKQVGEVVGKVLEELNGVLHDIVAVHIFPEFKDSVLDVASIESTVKYEMTEDGPRVAEVMELSGIALGDGRVETPGFSGATLLGAMQAFQEKDIMTKEEIQKAIREGKFSPSDIFTSDELKGDRGVRVLVEEATTEERAATKREEETRKRAEARHEKEKGELTNKVTELTKSAIQHRAVPRLGELGKEKKLSDKQSAFLSKKLKTTNLGVETEEDLDKALDKFITDGLEEFKEMGELFGVKANDSSDDRGAPSGDGATNNPMDPKSNPLIPS